MSNTPGGTNIDAMVSDAELEPFPTPGSLDEEDAGLAGRARRYLKAWGLRDSAALAEAAERLARTVRKTGAAEAAHGQLLVSIAGRWVEAFARQTAPSGSDWFWRAPALLSTGGAAFLETPIPSTSSTARIDTTMLVLPEARPRLMMQQAIEGSFEHLAEVIEGAEPTAWSDLAASRLVEPGS